MSAVDSTRTAFALMISLKANSTYMGLSFLFFILRHLRRFKKFAPCKSRHQLRKESTEETVAKVFRSFFGSYPLTQCCKWSRHYQCTCIAQLYATAINRYIKPFSDFCSINTIFHQFILFVNETIQFTKEYKSISNWTMEKSISLPNLIKIRSITLSYFVMSL